MKAKRVRDTLNGKVYPKDGRKPVRPATKVAFGYHKDFNVLEDQAVVIRFIFNMAAVGYSNESIAELLTKGNISPPKSEKWNMNSIDHMLKNRLYLGEFVWCEDLITTDYFDPIISYPLWNQVEEIKLFKLKY